MPQYRRSPDEPEVDSRPPSFVCLRIDYAQTVRLFVAGELDVATVPRLDAALREAEADAPLVVLDLGRLEFVAVAGVKLLLEADARMSAAGGRLKIVQNPAALGRILALIGAAAANALIRDHGSQPGSPGDDAAGLSAGRSAAYPSQASAQ